MIHHNHIDTLSAMNLKSGNGLGYSGLENGALIVEFDFHPDMFNDTDTNETFPHVSVQYVGKSKTDSREG